MRYALVNGEKVDPNPKLRGVCRGCSEEVTSKCGKHKVWHWAHLCGTHCDKWWEPETQWHRDWKDRFPKDWQEVPARDPATGELHIADVKTLHGLVVEFQHSNIHPDEVQARENFYDNMVWVVDGRKSESDLSFFRLGLAYNQAGEGLHRKYGRSRLFHRWHTRKPVFLDFGADGLWQVVRFDPATDRAQLQLLDIDEFVEAVALGIHDFVAEGGPAIA
ncbi:hypothetical protein C8245_22960 [Paracidovorax avenae]|uniref:competence protein CoiA n=1 Tax=Paracidovorax avenae TaxID=80867 RepID=UPI000D21F21B|nr:competence protein CoiA family protein [Paracidovorax avenae]AVS68140.1 hypothetical protein C8245_22960 [Paracidovorax avenae]